MPKSITPSISRRILAAYPDFNPSKIDGILRMGNITKPAEFDALFTLPKFAVIYAAVYDGGLSYQEAMEGFTA